MARCKCGAMKTEHWHCLKCGRPTKSLVNHECPVEKQDEYENLQEKRRKEFVQLGQEKEVLSAGRIIGWVLAGLFAVMTISAIVQLKVIPAIFMAGIAYMWSPYFDRWADQHNQRVTGWAKFIIMWVLLAILSFGGFYR